MKYIVDKMPETEESCPHSNWRPYPPIVEKTGDYMCNLKGNVCDLNIIKGECKGLKAWEN